MSKRPKTKKMDLDNLPSNPDTPIPARVAQGRTVKAPRAGVFASLIREIFNGLWDSVVMPSVKSTTIDFVTNGIQAMIYGQDSDYRARNNSRRGGHRSYNRMARPVRNSRIDDEYRVRPARRYEEPEELFQDIYFETRYDAERVLNKMSQRIERYGLVTVGDLNSFSGVAAANPTASELWGWFDLIDTRVERTSEGYIIGFPEPISTRRRR